MACIERLGGRVYVAAASATNRTPFLNALNKPRAAALTGCRSVWSLGWGEREKV